MSNEPTPVHDLDIDLVSSMARTRRLQTAILCAIVLLLAYVGASTGYLFSKTLSETTRIDQQISHSAVGECQFFGELATVPVSATATKAGPPTTELGAKLVINSRNAYLDLSCDGLLPPPGRQLLILSHRYGIPLSR
jgi:hypothetical protein